MTAPADRVRRGTRGTLGAAPYAGAELVLDLAEIAIEALFLEWGGPPRRAHEAGVRVARRVGIAWGGQKLYVPKPNPSRSSVSWFDQAARDASILREYNGRNMADVCDRWNLSPQSVHLAVTRARRDRRALEPLPASKGET